MRKILVLGGTGDIGHEVVKKLSNDLLISVGSSDVNLSNKESVNNFTKQNFNFDTIIHCAGHNNPGVFETLNLDDLEKSLRTNLLGFLPIVQNNIEYWKTTGSGRIVVISSLYGFLSRYGRMPYVISKHGLIGFVKTLAIELGPIGTNVNAISPGYINTMMTSKNNTPETIEKIIKGIPVGRMGSAREIADAVAFLASEQNTYINGHDLVVDGGYSIGGFQ